MTTTLKNSIKNRGAVLALAAASAIAGSLPARAAVVFWDGGSGGDWSDTSQWSSNAAGGVTGVSAAGKDVIFYASGNFGTPDAHVDTNSTASSLTFGNGQTLHSVTIDSTGGTLTLTGSANYMPSNFSSGAATNLGTVGIYYQNGFNTVTITAPILLGGSQLWQNDNTSHALAVSNILLGSNVLTTGGAGSFALNGIISGAGSLTLNGTGVVTFSSFNTYTGTTAINQGTASVTRITGTNTNFGNGSSVITLGDATHTGTISYTGTSTGYTRGLSIAVGGGEVDVTSSSVTLTISNAPVVTSGVFTMGGAGSFLVNPIGSSAISGSGSVVKTGTGTLTLASNANSTFSGGLSLKAGVLKIGSSAALGTGTFSIGDTAGSTPVTFDAATPGIAIANAQNWNQNFTFTGTNSLTFNTGAITLDMSPTASIGNILNINSAIGESVARSGITKTGSGTLILGGVNTFTGQTVLSTSSLLITNSQALGGAGASLQQATGTFFTLQNDAGISGAYNTSLTGTGTATMTADRVTSGAAVTHTLGNLTISGQTLALTKGGNVSTSAGLTFGTVTMTGTPVFDTAAGTVLTLGALSGSVAFTKQDSGSLVLTAASARNAGAVSLTGGTMILQDPAALGTATVPLTLSGGTLDLQTDPSVNAYNTTLTGAATIAADRETSGTTANQTLGTLVTGANTLSVMVGANVTGNASLAFGATTLSTNAVFDTAANTNLTLGALSGNVNFTKQGAGQLTLNSTSSRTSGVVTVSSGTLQLGNITALGTGGTITLNGGTLDLATDTTVTAYPVTVSSNSTILSDVHTPNTPAITQTLGSLTLGSRTLTIDQGNNVLGGAPTVAFGSLTLTASGTINTNAGVTTIMTNVGGSGSTLSISGAGDASIGGVIGTSGGGLVKSGTGTLTLKGTNTYTGNTTITGGEVLAQNSAALGTSGTITISNATLALDTGVALTRNVTFSTGSTLAGIGNYTPSSLSTISVPNISPGLNGIGTLALGKNLSVTGTTFIDIGTPGASNNAPGISDLINITGTGSLSLNTSNIAVNDTGTGGAGAYRIYTYGSGALTGTPTVTSNLPGTEHYKIVDGGFGTTTGKGVFLDVYRLGYASTIAPSIINLGAIHSGGVFGTGNLSLQNTAAADGFSEGLDASFGTTTGAAFGTGPITNLAAQATSNAMTVGISGAQNTGGTINGSIAINLASDGFNTSGAGTTSLGAQNVSLTGFVYTGQGIWNTNGGGNWSNFGGWASAGGVPGIDGALSALDTAKFGNALSSGSATITLNGVSPRLAGLTFTGPGSYTIARSGSQTLTFDNGSSPVQVSVAGNHTIAVPVILNSDTAINTIGSNDSLTMSGQISGSHALAKTGLGVLTLSGTNIYTGSTTVSAGTLYVNGSIAGNVIVNGATLGGTGIIHGSTELQNGGLLTPAALGTTGVIQLSSLTLDTGSTVQLDLANIGNYDQVQLTSIAKAGGATNTTLDVIDLLGNQGQPFHVNDSFQIFSTGIGSAFTSIDLPAGYTWDTSLLASQGKISVATVSVPEPGAFVLGLLALAPMAALGLRKARRAQKQPTAIAM